jgi:hypothetical protein
MRANHGVFPLVSGFCDVVHVGQSKMSLRQKEQLLLYWQALFQFRHPLHILSFIAPKRDKPQACPFSKSISINSNLAQEKVCECFNAAFFQALRLVYGYALNNHPVCHVRPNPFPPMGKKGAINLAAL